MSLTHGFRVFPVRIRGDQYKFNFKVYSFLGNNGRASSYMVERKVQDLVVKAWLLLIIEFVTIVILYHFVFDCTDYSNDWNLSTLAEKQRCSLVGAF